MTTPETSFNGAATVDVLDRQPFTANDSESAVSDTNAQELMLSAGDISVEYADAATPSISMDSASSLSTRTPATSVTVSKEGSRRAFGIANRMSKATDLDNLYQITVTELRRRLGCDRAFIYRFESQRQGHVIAESLSAGYTPTLGEDIDIVAFGARSFQDYKTQPVIALADASEEAISPHQMQLLQRFQVKASLSLAILVGEQIWGLLVVQQCDQPKNWSEVEIGLLYQVSTELTLQLQSHELQRQTQREIDRGETLSNVIRNIRGFSDIQQIFESTVRDLRNFLNADRVAVFQFTPGSHHSSGAVMVESVSSGFVPAKEVTVEDHCFGGQMSEEYRQGRIWAADNIYELGLADCYIKILEQFQVKANLVVPLLKDNQLWGLFCIHQCSRPRHWQAVEIAFVQRVAAQLDLAMQQAEYLGQVQEKTRQLETAVERERLVTKITQRLRAGSELSKALKATVQDIRQLMKADRVGLFQFDAQSNYSVGEFVVEDVSEGTRSAMAAAVQDHCFAEDQAENYRQGRYWVVNDVNSLDLPDCLADLLAQMQVKASIVVPLLKGDMLWGLFAVHQCQAPREWEGSEVQFVHRIGAQLNLALQQAEYLSQVQEKTVQLTETAEREKASKELLQQQVIELLSTVGPALEGDLTVRAPVTNTEVGTVASSYNTTLQSLQKIVLQVQEAANQVGATSKLSEISAVSVNQQAQQQALAINQALALVQNMMGSTETMAQDANQIEAAAQQANQIVQLGDTAMNRTVDGIMAIRATVAETNQRIKRLSESSQKVSKIVSLISHFTTQTQLLALNASIEATRAGQYGRGFAVVADEVRSLARQSAEAATEIEQFVQEIQMGTAEVSTAMETGIQQVAEGTDRVTDARQNLTAIVEATGQISQLIAEITQTTHKQADEFKVVTTTMTEATEIAKQTAESSDELAHSIQQVLNTAEALQTSTGKFKVR